MVARASDRGRSLLRAKVIHKGHLQVVLFDCNHFYNIDAALHMKLQAEIKRRFGELLQPRCALTELTLESLAANKRQVVVFYQPRAEDKVGECRVAVFQTHAESSLCRSGLFVLSVNACEGAVGSDEPAVQHAAVSTGSANEGEEALALFRLAVHSYAQYGRHPQNGCVIWPFSVIDFVRMLLSS